MAQARKAGSAAYGWTWYHSDHLGSATVLADTNGNPIRRLAYRAFGEEAVNTGTGDAPPYTYTGKELDSSGLMYYGARHYDPALARFITPDTVYDAGTQGLNRYSYALNNPLRYSDPSGHQAAIYEQSAAYDLSDLIRSTTGLETLPVYGEYTTHVKPIGQMTNVEFGAYFGDVSPISEALAAGMYGCVGSFEETIGTFTWSRIPADPVIVAHVVDALQGGRGMGGSTILLGGVLEANALQEQRALVDSTSQSKVAPSWQQKLMRKTPWKYGNTGASRRLGKTDKFGNITIKPGLSGKDLMETVNHEAVHRFFSPKSGLLREWRADKGLWAYNRFHSIKYLEEAIAETIGSGSLRKGLTFPLNGYGISKIQIVSETVNYFGITGGLGYLGYQASQEWGR